MRINCKTGEKAYSLTQYYNTKHWQILVQNYNESNLVKLCFKCKFPQIISSHFLHRSKKRIGNEKLTDLLPVCPSCVDARPNKSKKKAERRQLAPFGFRSFDLTDTQKKWIMAIRPNRRGFSLSKHYASKASSYKPSKQWVNAQVKKTCKWIRLQEKEIILSLENV